MSPTSPLVQRSDRGDKASKAGRKLVLADDEDEDEDDSGLL